MSSTMCEDIPEGLVTYLSLRSMLTDLNHHLGSSYELNTPRQVYPRSLIGDSLRLSANSIW